MTTSIDDTLPDGLAGERLVLENDDPFFGLGAGITQECRHCKQRKSLSQFGRDKRGRYGRETRCKTCSKVQHKGAGKAKASLGARPPSDYKCPICLETNEHNDWCPDHDGETGRVREWLCRQCNTALGKLNDSPEVLLRAVGYLVKHGKLLSADDLTVISTLDTENQDVSDRGAEDGLIIFRKSDS